MLSKVSLAEMKNKYKNEEKVMQYQMKFTRGQPDDEAIKLIKYYEPLALEYDSRGYCIATSEGKDSRVLGHLYRRSGVKHYYARSITGIDPPELVYFARKNFADYQNMGYMTYELKYNQSIWQMMLKKLFPPTRMIRYCCAELKENRRAETCDSIVSLGVRKAESFKRAKNHDELEISIGGKNRNIIMAYDNENNRRTFETCYTDNEKRVNPLINWSNEDIWNYSKDAGLEQCSLYQDGFDRLGCIGCPVAGKRGRHMGFARYPKIECLWRKSFDDMYRLRMEQGKKVKQSSGQEWFEKWNNEEWNNEEKIAITEDVQDPFF